MFTLYNSYDNYIIIRDIYSNIILLLHIPRHKILLWIVLIYTVGEAKPRAAQLVLNKN